MNAVILAGGFGSRLKPLTEETIKPMLTLANTPMIDYSVAHLADFGIRDYVFTLSYKPEQIIDWAIGYRDAVCHFSIETSPLGTLGGVKAAERFLDDTFVVLSGDALENVDLNTMLKKHKASGADVTMAVKRVEETHLYGVVETDSDGFITGFQEKPPKGEERSNLINLGVYIVDKRVLSKVPILTKFDFSKDLFPMLLKEGKIFTHFHDGYWCDIGDVKSYYKANFDMLGGGFYPSIYNSKRSAYTSYRTGSEQKSIVSANSTLVGNIAGSIIGRNCRIASGSFIENCIVMDNTIVKGRYYDAVIGDGYSINISKIAENVENTVDPFKIYQIFS